jgi:hypothetical protein
MRKFIGFAAAATAFIASPALAEVTVNIDTATGAISGFVGKGDVQMPFGLNNSAIQKLINANKQAVTFSIDAEVDGGSYVCKWTTGPDHNLTVHRITKKFEGEVTATIAADPRKTGQWTGWNLSGSVSASGDDATVPEVGDSCLGKGTDGVVESVSTGAGTLDFGAFYATIASVRHQLVATINIL